MRIKTHRIVLGILILALLLIVLSLLLMYREGFRINEDFDISTGDMRVQIYAFSFRIKNEISTTPFSREVRRLNIPVVNERIWKPSYRKVLGERSISYSIYQIIGKCNLLIEVFNLIEVSEPNRVAILERVLDSLQDEELAKNQLTNELNALLGSELEKRRPKGKLDN